MNEKYSLKLTCFGSLYFHPLLPELQRFERHSLFSFSVLSKNKVINLQVVKPSAGVTDPDAVR